MSEQTDTTPEERKAIRDLKSVAQNWPKTLWLFSAGGRLNVMRKAEDGTQVYSIASGGVDPSYRIDVVNIESDGGDW